MAGTWHREMLGHPGSLGTASWTTSQATCITSTGLPGGHLGEEAGHTQPRVSGRMSVGGPQRSEYQGREHSEAVEDEKAEATIAR